MEIQSKHWLIKQIKVIIRDDLLLSLPVNNQKVMVVGSRSEQGKSVINRRDRPKNIKHQMKKNPINFWKIKRRKNCDNEIINNQKITIFKSSSWSISVVLGYWVRFSSVLRGLFCVISNGYRSINIVAQSYRRLSLN